MSISAEPLGKRRGLELLEDVLAGFGKFIEIDKKSFHIQTHRNASYFFVGSRRRILSEIFNERKRPFYRIAINYPLGPLPLDESMTFIVKQFKRGGKI